jgi:hypothetical protein
VNSAQMSDETADLASLVQYGCYQRVWQMVRSCRKLATTPEREEAYERMEMAILGFMDAEWPRLVQAEVERDKVA